ncbi:hypothetical protein SeLEV6574_g05520 [Synchytrium endobioticum]|uniref:Rho-GAP domain-containing protein n=1 Tax=Synchytrium endobioticum TaxID=286115 RepID=A0A507CU09_9FUNG|nr:hypothetical protein SeLEV6574_g05520 [Synchytrium endobioticum]
MKYASKIEYVWFKSRFDIKQVQSFIQELLISFSNSPSPSIHPNINPPIHDDGLEEEVEVDEEQHSSQYYKMMFLNEFVQLDRRDSDMRDNQRAFIIRDTSIAPTITRLTEEDAAQFCWHMYRYVRSLTDNPLPASMTLEILRVAENNDDDESIAASLKRVVCKLPRSEYLLTKAFFSHLQRISFLCDIDIVRNLGVVFGPAIFRVTTTGQIPAANVHIHHRSQRRRHTHQQHHDEALASDIHGAAASLSPEGQAIASLFLQDFATANMNDSVTSDRPSTISRLGFFDAELSTVAGSETESVTKENPAPRLQPQVAPPAVYQDDIWI